MEESVHWVSKPIAAALAIGLGAIGAGLGIYVFGLVRDMTGDYHLAFIMGGAALVSAALITMGLSEHRYSTRHKRESHV